MTQRAPTRRRRYPCHRVSRPATHSVDSARSASSEATNTRRPHQVRMQRSSPSKVSFAQSRTCKPYLTFPASIGPPSAAQRAARSSGTPSALNSALRKSACAAQRSYALVLWCRFFCTRSPHFPAAHSGFPSIVDVASTSGRAPRPRAQPRACFRAEACATPSSNGCSPM